MEKALVYLARLLQLHNLLRRLQVGQVHVRDHVRQPTPLLHAKRRGLRAQGGSIQQHDFLNKALALVPAYGRSM